MGNRDVENFRSCGEEHILKELARAEQKSFRALSSAGGLVRWPVLRLAVFTAVEGSGRVGVLMIKAAGATSAGGLATESAGIVRRV